MASWSQLPSPPIKVKEVLYLVRTIWEAVLEALPRESVSRCNCQRREGYEAWVIHQSSTRGDLPPQVPPSFRRAYMKWNRCNIFCYTMLAPLQALLTNYGAQVEYYQCDVLAASKIEAAGRSSTRTSHHSVLIIILPDGSELCFDGTVEQFGWEAGSWQMDRFDFELQRMTNSSRWVNIGDALQEIQLSFGITSEARIVQLMRNEHGGYLLEARKHIEDMLANLEWDALQELSPVSRHFYVKEMAEMMAAKLISTTPNA